MCMLWPSLVLWVRIMGDVYMGDNHGYMYVVVCVTCMLWVRTICDVYMYVIDENHGWHMYFCVRTMGDVYVPSEHKMSKWRPDDIIDI